MEKLFATKNQHYVPRLLLRKFSADPVVERDRRFISLYILKAGRRVNQASISNECSDDYFYGTDGRLETALGLEEAKISRLIKDLSPEALDNLTGEDLHQFRMFAHWQRARTQAMVNQLNNQADALIKTLAREQVAHQPDLEISSEDIDQVKVTLTHPQLLAMSGASKTIPFVCDLAVKFIQAPPTVEFILSDHPTVACNQFVENNQYLSGRNGWTGMAIKGLQMFLPLSPELTLALYDPTTYEYGSPKSRICSANKRDVALLNKLQAINAVYSLYFRDSFPDQFLEELRQERELQPPIRDIRVNLGKMTAKPDGTESQVISLSGVNVRLGKKFHFVRQLQTPSYKGYSDVRLPIRDENSYAVYQELSRQFDHEVREKRKRRETGSDGCSDQ